MYRPDVPGNGTCSALVVGPRVIITASHCISRQTYTFNDIDVLHPARSPVGDVAVGTLAHAIPGVAPISVGADIAVGQEVLLVGQGFDTAANTGLGTMRFGWSKIWGFDDNRTRLHEYDPRRGTLAAGGDSGGPNMVVTSDGELRMIATTWGGNLTNRTSSSLLGLRANVAFLRTYAQTHGVDICGLTTACEPVFLPAALNPPAPSIDPGVAQVNYKCDNATLHIRLKGNTGTAAKFTAKTVDHADCEAQMAAASTRQAAGTTLAAMVTIAYCANGTQLQQLPLAPDGHFSDVIVSQMASREDCRAAAVAHNRGERNAVPWDTY